VSFPRRAQHLLLQAISQQRPSQVGCRQGKALAHTDFWWQSRQERHHP
jgi:hypothetical protein